MLSLKKVAERERVYGMPYEEWKSRYQTEANAGQLADFNRDK